MTTIERALIESIVQKPKNVMELSLHLGLSVQIIINCLRKLESEGIVQCKSGQYSYLKNKNLNKNIKSEVKGIINTMVENYDKGKKSMTFQKVWLDENDKKIYNALIFQLESFIENIKIDQKKQKNNRMVKDQSVVFWGSQNLSEVISQELAQL